MNEPHPFLVDFESHCGIGSTHAAELLGMARSSYMQIRSQTRPLKTYQRRHMEALMLLRGDVLDSLIDKHTGFEV